jgi:ribonuclease BN (tRNA processing enzyme)
VLGCGDAFGSGGRFHTCFYLEAPTARILIDIGTSALISMHRFRIAPASIDAVVLSHLHGDHFGGLPFLLLDAAFVTHRTHPLIVAGPRGVAERVRRTTELLFPGFWRGRGRSCVRFVELSDRNTTRVAGSKVTPFAVVHKSGAPAFALRVSCNGRTIAYSGDTAWTDALIEAARDADLFLCEASSFERPIPYHLTYKVVESRADLFRAKRVVLTHMGPDVLALRSKLSLECAEDGQVIVLRGRPLTGRPGRARP